VHLERRNLKFGQTESWTVYSEFQKVGGVWWPGKIVRTWQHSHCSYSYTVKVSILDQPALDGALEKRRDLCRKAVIWPEGKENLLAAKQEILEVKAGFFSHWMLLRHFARRQRWEKAKPHLSALQALLKDRWGWQRIRAKVALLSRRHEEWKQLHLEIGAQLGKAPRAGDLRCAETMIQQESGLLHSSERMVFLNRVKPVFDRRNARRAWDWEVYHCLRGGRQREKALAKLEAMGQANPGDLSLKRQYASEVAANGDVDGALTLLRTLAERKETAPGERLEFRLDMLQILWAAKRYGEYVRRFEEWDREDPFSLDRQQLGFYLEGLGNVGRGKDRKALITRWFMAYSRRKNLSSEERVRLEAVERRLPQSAELERSIHKVNTKGLDSVPWETLRQNWFRKSPRGQAVLASLYKRMTAGVETLPIENLTRLVWHFHMYRDEDQETRSERERWEDLFKSLHRRWSVLPSGDERDEVGRLLLQKGPESLHLSVLRHRAKVEKNPGRRLLAAGTLFNRLLKESWSAEVEAELAGLLPKLVNVGDDPPFKGVGERAILAVYHYAFWLTLSHSRSAVMGNETLRCASRRDVLRACTTALRKARVRAVSVLTDLDTKLMSSRLRRWIRLETLTLRVRAGMPSAAARDLGLRLLAHAVKEPPADGDRPAREIFMGRVIALLTQLSTRKKGGEEACSLLMNRLDDYLRLGMSHHDWRLALYALMVVADRGDEVEESLRRWMEAEGQVAGLRWARDLAYVLAERDRLEEAVSVFEMIRERDELDFPDLRALSDLQLALGRKDEYSVSIRESWERVSTYALGEILESELGRVENEERSVEMDPEVPVVLSTMIDKAEDIGYAMTLLEEFFRATKDYRLLACLPRVVRGHSCQSIYEVLASLESITRLILDEAVLDKLLSELSAQKRQTSQSVDQRALHLLGFMACLRGARQEQGGEPWAAKAQAALVRAFEVGEWMEGERARMARFLADRNKLSPPSLAQERLRLLNRLLQEAAPASRERFDVAVCLARVAWKEGRKEEAILILEGALREFRNKQERGRLPKGLNSVLGPVGDFHQFAEDREETGSLLVIPLRFQVGEDAVSTHLVEIHAAPCRQGLLLGQSTRVEPV